MTSHYQNQAYQLESAPTEHLQQNLGFSQVYGQQQRVPPYGPPYQTSEEYLQEPSTGRPSASYYPTPPSLLQQPQPLFVFTYDALGNPVPAYEQQQQQVPPCLGGIITAPYYNPNALPPPQPPTPRPRVRKGCASFKKYCLYLLIIIFCIALPLVYVHYF